MAGRFYWVSRLSMHPAWDQDGKIVVVLTKSLMSSKRALMVKGPYGPGIGIFAWAAVYYITWWGLEHRNKLTDPGNRRD